VVWVYSWRLISFWGKLSYNHKQITLEWGWLQGDYNAVTKTFDKKTVRDIDVKGKTVLLHAEFDAPLTADGSELTSDYRVRSSLETIKYLQEQQCKIILISKLGRPDGKYNAKMSLAPVAKRLTQLAKMPVTLVPDCVGEEVRQAVSKLDTHHMLMLENLRFHPEEEANDLEFAKAMAADTGADIFVQDCFALAHRREAGTDAITKVLPSVAGLHLEKEVVTITEVMRQPKRPMMAIVGGAKIEDKIDVLKVLIEIADFVAVGGAMANTFLKSQGIDIGSSLYDKDELPLAREILAQAHAKAAKQRFVFYLPQDGVVAHAVDAKAPTRIVDWSSHVIAEIENYPKRPPHSSGVVAADEKILDIGPFSGSFIAGAMQLCSTVVWNGTMGVTETKSLLGAVGPYAQGTELIIDAATGQMGHRPFSLVGGGDTVGYIEQRQLTDMFDHVSTGGGASLELMAGRKLPAVEALQDK
jgi:phosphoglycerate kinase